jgi:trk system potassium uptake protein
MINTGRIINIIGHLIVIEGLFILSCLVPSLIYADGDSPALLFAALLALVTGGVMWFLTRGADRSVTKREGFIIVSLVWVVFSLFGSLPFWLSGSVPTFTDAFFETISGFTTTGATILTDIEALPRGLLFWRSLTQWMGGMGIIVLSLAVLPLLGIGGMQLFIAEVPGPTKDKLHPRVRETARRLWVIYIIFTASETILLLIGGMNLFDAINHSFTTMATGGFSTRQESIAYFDSAFIQYVIILFMFIAGTNFTLSWFALHLRFDRVWRSEEFRFYLLLVLIFSLVTGTGLIITGVYGPEESFRAAAFQVVSIMTTTGYVTADYITWTPFLSMLIFILMLIGGSAGSTGGGIKVVRVLLILKNTYLEIKRHIYPAAVIPVKFNKRPVSQTIVGDILAFGFIYILILAISVVVISSLGYDMDTSIGSAVACLGNIGPGIGMVGPVENFSHFPVFGKWFLSLVMLLGRLELFTVLVLMLPSFWRK